MAPAILPAFDAASAVPVAMGLLARMAAVVAVGGIPLPPGVTFRIRVAVAVALAGAALPAAAARAVPLPLPLLVAGEAIVGLGLGLAVASVLAAAAWAGAILGSVSGLSWADDFAATDGDPQAAGAARLAWWLGLAGFLSAGGHLAVVAGMLDSVHGIPVGGGPDVAGWMDRVTVATGVAIDLAVTLAGPALAAVLTFHVAAALCVQALRVAPGQGLLQAAAAVVMVAALAGGAAGWAVGFGAAARDQIEHSFRDVRERP